MLKLRNIEVRSGEVGFFFFFYRSRMRVKLSLLHLLRKLKSFLVLSVTVSLLFYYTFQNEIDILNSYAENESLPSIDVHGQSRGSDISFDNGLSSVTDPLDSTNINGHNNVHNNQNDQSEDSSPKLKDIQLQKVNLNEKNKYFPLLVPSPDVDPSLHYEQYQSSDTSPPLQPLNPLLFKEKYPVMYEKSFPTDIADQHIPLFPTILADRDDEMLNKIHDIFIKSWEQQVSQWMNDPWPICLIDSLSTLYIMGETTHFQRALNLLTELDFKIPYTVSELIDIPDLTSRGLGGLLSLYELSGEDTLLVKAKQLGDFILRSFDTPNRLPVVLYPWRSPYNNRFPYKETNLGSMMKLTLELTKLSQLSSDNKYFNAIYHILEYLWETSTELPIKSLFPNVVDASGCKVLSSKELSIGTHQKDQMMKSINENLNFVFCHQFKHFNNYSSTILVNDKDYFSIYDSLAKLYSLLNVDILHLLKPVTDHIQALDSIENHKAKDDIDRNGDSLPSVNKQMIIDSKTIFHEAMENIINLMLFKPSAPINLTVMTNLYTNALYSLTTNDLEVQLRRDFKFQPETCQFPSTLLYGSKLFSIDKEKDNLYLQVASELIDSCFALFKEYNGVMKPLSLDWGSEYSTMHRLSLTIEDDETDTVSFNNWYFTENTKIENILKGKYTGFGNGFDIHNEVFASKVKQSNLNNEEWKRSYSFIQNEPFLNIKLTNKDIDMEKKTWNKNYHKHADAPLWINDIDDSKESLLSPFLIKSILYLYRMTGDQKWRQMGKELFEMTINKIKDMNLGPKGVWKVGEISKENIPSYWFSQTLKYYYLLYEDPSIFSFDNYIYTDSGHIISRNKKNYKKNKSSLKET